jgi:hypothetical protein
MIVGLRFKPGTCHIQVSQVTASVNFLGVNVGNRVSMKRPSRADSRRLATLFHQSHVTTWEANAQKASISLTPFTAQSPFKEAEREI